MEALKKFKHSWWGFVLSALAAFFATLAPALIRGLCLVFAVIVATAAFHQTEFGGRRWKFTIPAFAAFIVVGIVLFFGARHFDSQSTTTEAKATAGKVSDQSDGKGTSPAITKSSPVSNTETKRAKNTKHSTGRARTSPQNSIPTNSILDNRGKTTIGEMSGNEVAPAPNGQAEIITTREGATNIDKVTNNRILPHGNPIAVNPNGFAVGIGGGVGWGIVGNVSCGNKAVIETDRAFGLEVVNNKSNDAKACDWAKFLFIARNNREGIAEYLIQTGERTEKLWTSLTEEQRAENRAKFEELKKYLVESSADSVTFEKAINLLWSEKPVVEVDPGKLPGEMTPTSH